MRGFVERVDHPWVRTVCDTTLGPDYRIVEVGFDTPFPGATLQPRHRDFPVVDELDPITQKHDIEGLVMG